MAPRVATARLDNVTLDNNEFTYVQVLCKAIVKASTAAYIGSAKHICYPLLQLARSTTYFGGLMIDAPHFRQVKRRRRSYMHGLKHAKSGAVYTVSLRQIWPNDGASYVENGCSNSNMT